MNILVTGASGLIGTALRSRFSDCGHRVVPLLRSSAEPGAAPNWDPGAGRVNLESPVSLDAVVHLAGETIAQRWTPAAKERIRASRVEATRLLSAALCRLSQPPRVMVCASATGFYGHRPGEILDEHSGHGTGFLAEVCRDWEAAAEPAGQCGIRVITLRIGVVLAAKGGALAKMLPAFRMGLGGRLGDGQQYWSWITVDDLTRVVQFVVEREELSGALNAVAPRPATTAEFTGALGRVLHRPAVLPLPAFAVKALFGEMGREALLASAQVTPAVLTKAGFTFRWPELEPALRQLLG